MSVIITGLLIRNLGKTSVALTEADGPQTFSEEYEARLVSEGIAKYIDHSEPPKKSTLTGVATAVGEDKEQDVTPPKAETGSKSEKMAQEVPKYSTNMKVVELREILEECQIPYKVGMSKANIVAALDAYFEDDGEDDTPPDLRAEDPIV